jgi:hypothetical protein
VIVQQDKAVIVAKLRRSRSTQRIVLDLCSKNSQLRLSAVRDKIMQRLGFPLIHLIVFGGVALGLAALAAASNLPEENIISPPSLQPSAATHETRAELQRVIEFRNANEITPPIETVSSAPPTRSSFMATWGSVSDAKGYLLDVSTSNTFSSYVDGYHDLDVGNVNGRAVTRPCPNQYEAESSDNTLTGGAGIQSCPTCSGGADVGYVGNNSGTLQFNGVTVNTTHNYVVTIWYTNGDAVRDALLSVNGSPGTPLSFPSTGSFQTVGSIQTTVTLNAGSNNTLTFYNPITGDWAPDFDRIGVNCPVTPPAAAARAAVADFNSDGHPDYVLRKASTRQTAIWYLNNNVFISGALGPGITVGWVLDGVADFNRDVHPDYALFNASTDRTAIWYMSGPTRIASAYGPTLAGGWELVATADFNANGYPDYVLYKPSTRQTAIWYLRNNVYVSAGYGPTLPVNWSLVGAADFNRNGHRDYVLFNSSNHQTAIWYLSGRTFLRGAYGPTIPSGWALVATADFNSDGHPDYLLYNPTSRQTAIWYLNNNVFVSGAFGPTPPAGWSLVGQ